MAKKKASPPTITITITDEGADIPETDARIRQSLADWGVGAEVVTDAPAPAEEAAPAETEESG